MTDDGGYLREFLVENGMRNAHCGADQFDLELAGAKAHGRLAYKEWWEYEGSSEVPANLLFLGSGLIADCCR